MYVITTMYVNETAPTPLGSRIDPPYDLRFDDDHHVDAPLDASQRVLGDTAVLAAHVAGGRVEVERAVLGVDAQAVDGGGVGAVRVDPGARGHRLAGRAARDAARLLLCHLERGALDRLQDLRHRVHLWGGGGVRSGQDFRNTVEQGGIGHVTSCDARLMRETEFNQGKTRVTTHDAYLI